MAVFPVLGPPATSEEERLRRQAEARRRLGLKQRPEKEAVMGPQQGPAVVQAQRPLKIPYAGPDPDTILETEVKPAQRKLEDVRKRVEVARDAWKKLIENEWVSPAEKAASDAYRDARLEEAYAVSALSDAEKVWADAQRQAEVARQANAKRLEKPLQNAIYQNGKPVRTFVEPAPRPQPASLEQAAADVPKRKLPPQVWSWEELGQREMVAKESTEVDTLARKVHDIWNETEAALPTVQDEAERVKLFDKAKQRILALQGSSENVERQHQSNLSRLMPQLENRFNEVHHGMIIKQLRQDGETNIQSAVEAADELGAATQIQKMIANGLYGKAEGEKRIAGLPAEIALTAAQKKINEGVLAGDPKVIEDAAKDVKNLKGISPEALQKATELVEAARVDIRRMQAERSDQHAADIVDWETTPNQTASAALKWRDDKIAVIVADEKAGRISGVDARTRTAQARAAYNRITAPGKADPRLKAKWELRILDIGSGTPKKELDAAFQELVDDADGLGEEFPEYVAKFKVAEKREAAQGDSALLDLAATQRGIILEHRPAFFRMEMAKVDQARAAGKPMSTAEKNQMFAEDAVAYQAMIERVEAEEREQKRAEKEVLPPAVLGTVLGELKAHQTSGGLLEGMLDIENRRDAIRLIVKKVWYSYKLSPEDRKQLKEMLDAEYPVKTPDIKKGLNLYDGPEQQLPPAPPERKRTAREPAPEPAEGIPPVEKREVGKIYTNAAGKRAKWNGTAWEVVQ
jgi:hypothetical protein